MSDDDKDYRRNMDEKLIGFLSAHEVWMLNDTAWKHDTSRRLDGHSNRLKTLETWRTMLTGAWAVIVAGWYFLTGHK